MDYIANIQDIKWNNFYEKIIQIKRVTKIVKGGRNLTFQVLIIIGNKINKVGIGLGHASTVLDAIEKAITNAKQNLLILPVTKSYSIPYVLTGKYKSANIKLYPASHGTGLIISKPLRTFFEFGGLRNIYGKQLGSSNILNNLRAIHNILIQLINTLYFNNLKSIKLSKLYNNIFLTFI